MWHCSHINPAPRYHRRQERADLCVCVCVTVSLDRGGASSTICSAGKFSDPMNSTKCSHPEVLVESCFWSSSEHFAAAPTGAQQLPCKPRPVSLRLFFPSIPSRRSDFQLPVEILVIEQLSHCRHFLLRHFFFLFCFFSQFDSNNGSRTEPVNNLWTMQQWRGFNTQMLHLCRCLCVDVEKEQCHDFPPVKQAAEWQEK